MLYDFLTKSAANGDEGTGGEQELGEGQKERSRLPVEHYVGGSQNPDIMT